MIFKIKVMCCGFAKEVCTAGWIPCEMLTRGKKYSMEKDPLSRISQKAANNSIGGVAGYDTHAPSFEFIFCHLMKEEMETQHFEHTMRFWERTALQKPLLAKQVENVCVSPQPVSHGFYRVMSV